MCSDPLCGCTYAYADCGCLAAGDELLRSKSLDRDSYNSGDWFNRWEEEGGWGERMGGVGGKEESR